MSPAEGARQLEIEVSKEIFAINTAALARSTQALNVMRNCAMEVLSQDGTGRRYGKHVASSPGQPPAPDTGSLRRNWHQQQLAAPGIGKGIRVTLRLKSKMHYAVYLEGGTRKMAARPFKDRIENKARPKVTALFASI